MWVVQRVATAVQYCCVPVQQYVRTTGIPYAAAVVQSSAAVHFRHTAACRGTGGTLSLCCIVLLCTAGTLLYNIYEYDVLYYYCTHYTHTRTVVVCGTTAIHFILSYPKKRTAVEYNYIY